jgi:hypothetical protein
MSGFLAAAMIANPPRDCKVSELIDRFLRVGVSS